MMEIENGRQVLDISDEVLFDGEVCVEIQDYRVAPSHDLFMYIDKEQARKVVAHLNKVFELKESNND